MTTAVLTNDEFPRAVNSDGSPKDASDMHLVGGEIGEDAAIGARAVCGAGQCRSVGDLIL